MPVDPARAEWRKSTHSDNGGQCVEAALNLPGTVPVRDSKDPDGPALAFPAEAWRAFVTALRNGELGTAP
ncbi:DUF397 domain-containing protein [Kitasatospora sp. NBC_00458]|uniref:DUF397 domain-containing protein n=1 Tax=Kitasatospora sp. NBC_00458 TaxID=2903568 RepID=UPI002E1A00BA